MEISWKVSLPHSLDVLEIIELSKKWISGGKFTVKAPLNEAGRLDIQRCRVPRVAIPCRAAGKAVRVPRE
jgi:hypothetical protein